MANPKVLLSDLAFGLIGLEDGDLMALADLTEKAQELHREWATAPQVGTLMSSVEQLFASALKGDLDEFPKDRIGAALDLLAVWSDYREKGKKPPPPWPQSVEAWLHPPKAEEALVASEPLAVFLTEAAERLTEAQALILDLEANPEDRAAVDSLFRTFHTIKGECGFLKIASLGELAHNVENLLDLLRSKVLELDGDTVDLLFTATDHSRDILAALTKGDLQAPPPQDLPALLEQLAQKALNRRPPIGDLLMASGKLTKQDVNVILTKQRAADFTKKFGEIAAEESLVTTQEVAEHIQLQRETSTAATHDPLIKVKASQVNYLVEMIGELLIVENQLDEHDKNVVQLKKISRSIQDAAMKLRTVKVKNLFINLKRITRDAAKQLGKTVQVETRGEDLEIDRNLVEVLEEPLMHLVRNSVGHGIESSEARSAAGKPETGTVTIEALRRGNNIIIAVRDDGRGLDEQRILDKAVATGLVPPEKRGRLSRSEVFNLIFLPGFSTSEEVNAISGRGVGMDIVKSTVSATRGRVDIKSEAGRYTEFSLVFPLSLAIIDGMIVLSNGGQYILPIANIVESLKIQASQLMSVEGRAQVLNLRQEILPVIVLSQFFTGLPSDASEGFAIVVDHEDKKYALIVDGIVAKREVVIKSLGKKFKHLPAISSAAVLPGGTIGFVVNIEEIVRS